MGITLRVCFVLLTALFSSIWSFPQEIPPAPSSQIDALIAQLGTRYWEEAVDALVVIGDPAVEPLIAALNREEGFTSARTCRALARIGTPSAVVAVFAAMHSQNVQVRGEAALALQDIKSEKATQLLIEVLSKEPVWRVRMFAARSLGETGSDKAADALLKALADPSEYVRGEAAAALGRLKSARSVEPLLHASRDENGFVRQRATEALVMIGDPAVAAIGRMLRDADAYARWTLTLMLGKMASEQAVPVLLEALIDADWMVRNEAAVALALVRSDKSAEPLRALLGHENLEVRKAAAWVLKEIESPRSGPYLQAIADRRADGIRVPHPLYPQTLDTRPEIPSPSRTADNTEVVVALTAADKWAIVPATPENSEAKTRQWMVDARDFPSLASSGLHSEKELDGAQTITGRSLAEITDLGRPGRLSTSGFMADDEDIVSVLKGDNRLVSALRLTHQELARPLFHVWNMVNADATLGRWNMAEHRWRSIKSILYNGKAVLLDAADSKGGQLSIFDDGLEGAFWIKIRRELDAREKAFLEKNYAHLTPTQTEAFVKRLSCMTTGEMQPHYILWYGFYEGHTEWRTDPIAIAFIFGLRSLEEIEAAFPGQLYKLLTLHFVRHEPAAPQGRP